MMQKFIDFFGDAGTVGIMEVTLTLALSVVTAAMIFATFIRCAETFSNRRHFGRIFILVTICTALIIMIIKSSIALSLGLVGALSIVRFRAAIKEPEELTYLFLCITAGVGYGANEYVCTFFAIAMIMIILIIRSKYFGGKIDDTYNLSVRTKILPGIEMANILKQFTLNLKLRRVDSNDEDKYCMFHATFKNFEDLESAINEIKKNDPSSNVSFVSSEIQA
jgi:hypothetical protein